VKSMDWAVEAIRSGVFPDSPAEPPITQRPTLSARRASLSSKDASQQSLTVPPAQAAERVHRLPGKSTSAEPQAAIHGANEALAEGQAQAPEDIGDNQDLIEDSQSLRGACNAAPMSPGVNNAQPRMRPGSFSVLHSEPRPYALLML